MGLIGLVESRTIRRMGKAFRRLAGVIAVATAGGVLVTCGAGRVLEVLYFYDAACSACDESRRSLENVASLAAVKRRDGRIRVSTYDVGRSGEASTALFAAIERHRIPKEKQALPLLIINGAWYAGLEEAERAIDSLVRTRH
jgi:hypothetical protein